MSEKNVYFSDKGISDFKSMRNDKFKLYNAAKARVIEYIETELQPKGLSNTKDTAFIEDLTVIISHGDKVEDIAKEIETYIQGGGRI